MNKKFSKRGLKTHLSAGQLSNFNFQKYIKHSLDKDFKTVISISPLMWLTVVIFMLVDIHGWHSYLWISFAPLVLVLAIGTKMEVIVAKMAIQLKKQKKVFTGVVELDDNLFWLGKPEFVLDLLHVTLFLNAFEMAFFIWVTKSS
ncbi:MLO-like protein [Striga asiatica]|uniref:MLO-like protein n=1 Tax=Striga asiatica TaxID=4170 RepID=A0A5A7RA49_STRAF|nr:MLO-like protein [Striga asiatica]